METIDLISGIAVITLYIALIALIIYLIIALKRIVKAVDNINGAVDKMEQKVDQLTTKAEPLIDNSLAISNDIKEISGTLKVQAVKVEGIVDSVKKTTDSIIEFEQNVQKEVETNVYDTFNMIAAISRGVKTFLSVLTGSSSTNGAHRKTRSDSSSKDSYLEQEDDYYN